MRESDKAAAGNESAAEPRDEVVDPASEIDDAEILLGRIKTTHSGEKLVAERTAVLDAIEEPDEEALEAEEEEAPDEQDLLQAGTIKSSLLMVEDSETADSIRLYLREIGRVRLLTAADEVSLSQAYERGEEAKQVIAKRANLPADDAKQILRAFFEGQTLSVLFPAARFAKNDVGALSKDLNDGAAAKKKLTESNLRLVVSIAKRYAGRGMLFLDLIQEGNLGLIRAVEKFDWRRGFKFSTYATWWIRQAITRALADQSRTIRIPVHMVETLQRVLKVQREIAQRLGREPSFEELAKDVGMPPERVAEILRMTLDPVSLETPVGEEDDSRLGDFIEDEAADQPLQVACRSMMNEYLSEILDMLTERERQVIQLRYGLTDGQPKTLEEVGKEFGVTRERIRQIETRTLAKLRHPTKVKMLEDLIE